MKILEEKLDKEKLLEIVSDSGYIPPALVKFIAKRGDKEMPEKFFNSIFSDENISDVKKAWWSGAGHIAANYSSFFINNNKKIPEKIIKIVSLNSLWSMEVIKNFIKNDKINVKEVPNELWKSISSNPNYCIDVIRFLEKNNQAVPQVLVDGLTTEDSKKSNIPYFYAVDLTVKNKEVPDKIIKSVAESENILSSLMYKLFLETIGKEVPQVINNRLMAQYWGQEYNYDTFFQAFKNDKLLQYALNKISNKTINEKLDKERLLNIATSDFNGSFNLVNAVIDVDNPDKESIRQVLDNENVLKSFIDLERTLEMTAKFSEDGPPFAVRARVWYAIILILHDRKVPDALNQKIAENKVETINYYGFLKKRGLEIPDVILKSYLYYKEREGETKKHIARLQRQRLNESLNKQTITEALDKEKLLNVIENNPESSMILAKRFIEQNKKVPENFIKSIAKDSEYALPYNYAMFCLKNNIKVPEIINDAIAKHRYDTYDYVHNLILQKKLIPDVILNAHFNNTNDFTSHSEELIMWIEYIRILLDKNEEIPEKVLNNSLGASIRIAELFIEAKKEIPDIVLKTVAKDPVNCKFLVRTLLKNKIKVPEIIKNGLWDLERKELEEIEKETITEALDKEKLIYSAIKETPVAIDLIQQLAYTDKDIPDLLSRVIAERNSPSTCARIAAHIIAYSDKEVPEALLEKISKNRKIANDIAYIYKNNRKEVPDIIKNVLSKRNREFYNNWINEKTTINEALDKDKLLDSISKDEEAYDKILRYYFYDKNTLPPEQFIDMISEDLYASTMFAEYCLEKNKEIRPDIIQRIAKSPRSSYTIAALMKMENRDVPDILTYSIRRDPLSSKHYEEFLSKRSVPTNTKVYAKI